jgi:hypothetical protein
MTLQTKFYQVSSGTDSFDDEFLRMSVSRRNPLKKFLPYGLKGDSEQVLRMVLEVVISSGDGQQIQGGAVVNLGDSRIFGVVTEGKGSRGQLSEATGNMEGFSVPVNSIVRAEATRGFRKKTKALALSGSDEDNFALAVLQVIGTLKADGEGVPASFGTLESRLDKIGIKVTG